MSDSERDNPPADGDIATHTPPTGNEPVAENGDAPVLPTPGNGERRPIEEPLTPAGGTDAPPQDPSDYGHHAFTEAPRQSRRARRRAAKAAAAAPGTATATAAARTGTARPSPRCSAPSRRAG